MYKESHIPLWVGKTPQYLMVAQGLVWYAFQAFTFQDLTSALSNHRTYVYISITPVKLALM